MWLLTYCFLPISGWGVWVSHGAPQCTHTLFKTETECQKVVTQTEQDRDRQWANDSYLKSLGQYARCTRQLS